MRGEMYLTKTEQYAFVLKKGNAWVDNLMVMKATPNGLELSRYGVSVSRRVGNAVTRNRVKRLFREVLRLMPLQSGWDMVFIARPPIAHASYARLKEVVEGLLSQAQLLKPQET